MHEMFMLCFIRKDVPLLRRTRKEFVRAIVYGRSSNASVLVSLHSTGILGSLLVQGTMLRLFLALPFLISSLNCLEEGKDLNSRMIGTRWY